MALLLDAIEALATPHGLDRYLELVHPMLTVREMRAEVTAVARHTDDSVTLTLRPTRQWRGFEAGQFVQVTVDVDGVRRTRCYSPGNSQHRRDGRLELTIRAHPEGVVSQFLHAQARPGLVLGLAQADGVFRLPTPRPPHVLLISGGSGITPVLSMLRTLIDEGHRGQVVFLHYARRERDVPFVDELRAITAAHPNLRVVFAYTEQQVGSDLRGRFSPAHLRAVAPWHERAPIYLCGPPSLMNAVREHRGGVDVISEDFLPAPVVPATGEITGTVRYTRSDRAAANTGDTLLEQAEAAGLAPRFGCRMGICFTCTSVKTSGCTQNVRTGERNGDPDTEVQLCITRAVGDVELDI